MADYTAIFFDALGTLFDITDARRACAAVSKNPGRFVAEWRRRQLEYTWLRTLMRRYVSFEQISLDALEATAAAEGVKLDEQTRYGLLRAWLKPPPFLDVLQTIPRLAESGGPRLGILSNGDPGMLNGLVAHAGLISAFPWIISAEEAKAYKPSAAVYELAVKAVGAKPESILFVSANAWDVAGAGAAGLTTVWLNRTGATPDRLGAEPSFVIPSLADLPWRPS